MSKQGRQYPTKANILIFGDLKELDRIFETQPVFTLEANKPV